MSELRELYQTTILDHNKQPRNFRTVVPKTHEADGYNPLCGDRVTVQLSLSDDGIIQDVGFQGSGCAISTASASLMTEAVKGRPLGAVQELFDRFHRLVTVGPTEDPDLEAVGKLRVFAGVREFPMRVKCATLAWHTLRSAMEGGGTVKTE